MKVATKIATNIVVAGAMLGAALLLKKLVRSRRAAHLTPTDEAQFVGYEGFSAMAELDNDLTAIARESALANADHRDVAAHQEIAEQRARH